MGLENSSEKASVQGLLYFFTCFFVFITLEQAEDAPFTEIFVGIEIAAGSNQPSCEYHLMVSGMSADSLGRANTSKNF